MLRFKQSFVQSSICVLGMCASMSTLAQNVTISPFERATPEQQQRAEAAQRAKLNAIAQWNRLPQTLRDQLASQLAQLNNEQRLALISSVPSLNNLTAEEKQALLDNVAQDVPLPAIANATLTLIGPNPVQIGNYVSMDLTILSSLPRDALTAGRMVLYYNGQLQASKQVKCGFKLEDSSTSYNGSCSFAVYIDVPNPTIYAEIEVVRYSYNSQNGDYVELGRQTVRTNSVTVPTF